MKILLIHPQLKKYVQPKLVPLGILSIASILEKEGHTVNVLDLNVTPNLLFEYLEKKPDIIGITATTPLVKEAWNLIVEIKKRINVPVVLGGPHPSALPEESIRNGADIVVRNEGEKTIIELCKVLEKKGDLSEVLGITYKKDDKIINNPDRPLLSEEELNELPFPAYHLIHDLSYYSTPQPVISEKVLSLSIVTSRGCPFSCNYCFKGVFGKRWRAFSADYVVKLWKFIYEKYNVKEIGVQDDAFNIDMKRVSDICDGLKKEGIKTRWTTAQGLRVDRINKGMLIKMKEVGFFRTGFGIESGNQDVVSHYIGKAIFLDKVKEAVKIAKEVGIEPITYFMIGNSGENEKTMQETINFAIGLDTDVAHFTITVPFPGTPLYNLIKEMGEFLITDWSLYGYTQGICYFEIGEVKKELVERMWRKAYRSYYLRPNAVFRLLTKKGALKRLPQIIQASFQYLGLRKV